MSEPNLLTHYEYRMNSESGLVYVYIPRELTPNDFHDIDDLFRLIMRQLERRREGQQTEPKP